MLILFFDVASFFCFLLADSKTAVFCCCMLLAVLHFVVLEMATCFFCMLWYLGGRPGLRNWPRGAKELSPLEILLHLLPKTTFWDVLVTETNRYARQTSKLLLFLVHILLFFENICIFTSLLACICLQLPRTVVRGYQ